MLAGQSVPGDGWGKSPPEEQARRSVYIHVKRSLLVPILDGFDLAETDRAAPVRFATTQPTQALGMLNGEFLQRAGRRRSPTGCAARPATTSPRRSGWPCAWPPAASPARAEVAPRRRADRSARSREDELGADAALQGVLPAGAEPERVRVPGLNEPHARPRHEQLAIRTSPAPPATFCGRTRREFLWEAGAGLHRRWRWSDLLARDGFFAGRPARPSRVAVGQPAGARSRRTSPPKAKSVIFLFMYGGPSHVDTFDYKPKLYALDGKTIPVKTFGRGGHEERGPRRRAEVEVQAVRPVRQVGQRPVPAPRRPASTTSPSSTR